MYDPEIDKKNTLYSGTEVIKTSWSIAVAMVVWTGFLTSKGILVKSIMFPKPIKFKFVRDSLFLSVFIGIMISIVNFCILPWQVGKSVDLFITVMKKIILIIVAVPPALPAAMSAGIVESLRRLKNAKIYCIDIKRINVVGWISLMVFDKTGTLTDEGLSLNGFKPIAENEVKFDDFIEEIGKIDHLYEKDSLIKRFI